MAAIIDKDSVFLEKLGYNDLTASEKSLVDSLITVGQIHIENYCNRTFIDATYTAEVHDGNSEISIFIKNPPLNTLTSVTIQASSFTGATTTTVFTSDKFDSNSNTGEIRFKPGSFLSSGANHFTAGFQNILIAYTGGFTVGSDNMKPIEKLIADFTMELFDSSLNEDTLVAEKLGNHFYKKVKDFADKMFFSNRKMLSVYKIRRVGVYC